MSVFVKSDDSTVTVNREEWERVDTIMALMDFEHSRMNGDIQTADSAEDLISKLEQ